MLRLEFKGVKQKLVVNDIRAEQEKEMEDSLYLKMNMK